MKILYVSSEAFPFCKTGGLADVAGSLPPALARNGDDVAVILPLCPDKGSSMTYDLSRGASTYLDDDIELLKRMRFMTKEAKV